MGAEQLKLRLVYGGIEIQILCQQRRVRVIRRGLIGDLASTRIEDCLPTYRRHAWIRLMSK